MKIFQTIVFILLPIWLFSQIRVLENPPFPIGEKLKYHAVYNWGILNLKAGIVEFSVEEKIVNEKSNFHFKSIGNSLPAYDWIYTVRDTFQSIVMKNNFQAVYYERNTSEGGYIVQNTIHFIPKEKTIKVRRFNNKDGSSDILIPFNENILDLQTAVYFARMLDFSEAIMGEEYKFQVIIDGSLYEIPIRYEGLETISLNNTDYNCFRISTKVIEGTIFRSNQTIKIWVHSDGSQVPVLVEAPIIVGKVKAELIE